MLIDPPNLRDAWWGFRARPLAAEVEVASACRPSSSGHERRRPRASRRSARRAARDDFVYLTVSTGIGGAIVIGRPAHARPRRHGRRAGPPDGRHRRAALRLRRRRPPRGDSPRARGIAASARGAARSGVAARSSSGARRQIGIDAARRRRRRGRRGAGDPACSRRSWSVPAGPFAAAVVSIVNVFDPDASSSAAASRSARASACSARPARRWRPSAFRLQGARVRSCRRRSATTSGSSARAARRIGPARTDPGAWRDCGSAARPSAGRVAMQPGPARLERSQRRSTHRREPSHDSSRRHQRLRPHRPPVAQGAHRARARTSRSSPSTTSSTTAMNALLFKHDSTYGAYPGHASSTPTTRSSSTAARSRCSQEKDPAALPWGDLGVDIVLESTGLFTDADKAARPPRRRRQEGHHQRARQGRGHHHRARRQRGPVRPGDAPRSSATPAAPRTAWRRRPRSSTTSSASSAA